jgi:hypothetical protein
MLMIGSPGMGLYWGGAEGSGERGQRGLLCPIGQKGIAFKVLQHYFKDY